ncbi:MAG TPA: hypothetical protein VKR06_26020 [Ktedonosporobacter sp.]|nr:hypothetical protein [Ktedonosporobacter sp.]
MAAVFAGVGRAVGGVAKSGLEVAKKTGQVVGKAVKEVGKRAKERTQGVLLKVRDVRKTKTADGSGRGQDQRKSIGKGGALERLKRGFHNTAEHTNNARKDMHEAATEQPASRANYRDARGRAERMRGNRKLSGRAEQVQDSRKLTGRGGALEAVKQAGGKVADHTRDMRGAATEQPAIRRGEQRGTGAKDLRTVKKGGALEGVKRAGGKVANHARDMRGAATEQPVSSRGDRRSPRGADQPATRRGDQRTPRTRALRDSGRRSVSERVNDARRDMQEAAKRE